MTSTLWQPGTHITWRYGDVTKPHVAAPRTVVRDDERWLVAWLAVGTPILMWARADGRPIRSDPATLFTAPRVQAYATWQDHDVLRIYEKGRHWSVWVFFDGRSGDFRGWYCNIERPHERIGRATISQDHVLDVWVDPDRSATRKDEDELVLAVEQGRYTPQEAVDITAMAGEIEQAVADWASPFCDGWEHFRPDPTWAVPGPAALGRAVAAVASDQRRSISCREPSTTTLA